MIDVPVLVKDALRDGRLKKNYIINVLNDDGTTDFVIDNDTLVSESVDIDERMCSGDTIKFGLCEGSSIEFQYFNHPNIYGRKIQVFVDIWSDYVSEYETKWHDVTTLNGDNWKYTIDNAGEYKLEWPRAMQFRIVWTNSGTIHSYDVFIDDEDWFKSLGNMVEGDTIETFSRDNYSASLKGYYETPASYWYSIPMGFFTVEKCSRQASTGIKKVTAYNKLQSDYLDAKANDILLEDFDGDGTTQVTVYDIEKHLLDNYGIIEAPKISESFVGTPGTAYYGGFLGFMFFKEYANVKTPFSACEWWSKQLPFTPPAATSAPTIYGTQWGFGRSITIPDGDYWELAFIKGDFGVLVQNIVDSIVDALFYSINTQYADRESLEVAVRESLGFTFRAEITMNGQTKQYNLAVNPNETLKMINDIPNKKGPATIHISMPNEISINGTNDTVWTKRGQLLLTDNTSYSYYVGDTAPYYSYSSDSWTAVLDSEGDPFESDMTKYFVVNHLQLDDAEKITMTINDIPDFTLREIASASYETVCQFGKLDRVTDLFSGVELNHSRLYPATTLYPDTALYPDGAALSSEKSMYSKLWADDGNVQKWRNLIITYKGLDENNQEKDFTLERVVNSDGTQDYNMSDNWLFKNLVWTASDVGDYADAMVSKMRDVTWFPFEMWCAGLPYIETGDELEISIGEETYTSYVLQRQLKGIQNLQDTFINGTLDIF